MYTPSPRSFFFGDAESHPARALPHTACLLRTQILFHPVAQNRLFSSSTDGLVCMFDTTQSNEDDALVSGALSSTLVEYSTAPVVGNQAMAYVPNSPTQSRPPIRPSRRSASLETMERSCTSSRPIRRCASTISSRSVHHTLQLRNRCGQLRNR
jgi:hypothetical protein